MVCPSCVLAGPCSLSLVSFVTRVVPNVAFLGLLLGVGAEWSRTALVLSASLESDWMSLMGQTWLGSAAALRGLGVLTLA